MLFSMPRIIQHSHNFCSSSIPKPKLWIFSSRTPKPNDQGCIFFCLNPPPPPGAKKWPNKRLGEKKWLKGDEKRGKCIFFSQLVKSIHIFYSIDFKVYKITFFRLRRAPLILITFSCGKNINQERGGGKNMNFKFNIHPWCWYIFNMELMKFCDAINIKGVKWKSDNKLMQLITKNQIKTRMIIVYRSEDVI